jgi:hypothetical protein
MIMLSLCKPAKSQVASVVTDPKRDFRENLEWIDTKAKWLEDKMYYSQTIVTLKEQLQKAQEIKEATEDIYNQSVKVYEEGKRMTSIIDAGIPGLIFGLETSMGQSLNPADYIPAVGGKSDALQKLVSYKAGSNLNGDQRAVLKDLLQHDKTSTGRIAFTQAGYELLQTSNSILSYKKDLERQKMLDDLALACTIRDLASKMTAELMKEENIGMNEGDRMMSLLKLVELQKMANDLELESIGAIEEEINEAFKEPEFQRKCVNKAINWQINNEMLKTKKYNNSSIKFSLADWERKNPKGYQKK